MSGGYRNVVYVALGRHRIRAAQRYTAELTADGAAVLLIAGDHAEWADQSIPPGATVHRVRSLDAAKRLVLDRSGPLREADLLVAGDLQAVPVAWAAAARRRPRLAIHLEPPDHPGRTTAPADLAVVTPWYPAPNDPFVGSFVKATVAAVHHHFDRVAILHTQAWAYPLGSPLPAERIGMMTDRIGVRSGYGVVEDSAEGEITRVTVPMLFRGREYAEWANAHLRMLREALPTGRIEAPLVHAHTGIYGGFAATRLARPDARIVVTEHSSFLNWVFKDLTSRRMYEEVLQRVDAVLCVSRHLRDQIADQFPGYASKLSVVPNVIDFAEFTMRPSPPRDLLRWLYVGRLHEQKGVQVLVEAFARVAADEPRATLTLVGSGEMEGPIRTRVAELGMADRIELHPPVPPEDVVGLMHGHDLLVHASRGETFGMTVVEAVATGTPVLVARTSGPEETLAGLEGIAGLFFEVSEDPEVIVQGYRDLRKRAAELDLAQARASLLARYGREAVASQLIEAYRPPAPVESPPPPLEAGRVVVVATRPRDVRRVRNLAQAVVDRGLGVELVTTDPEVYQRLGLDDRVRIHSLSTVEERNPILRLEQFLVYRAPGTVLAAGLRQTWKLHALWPEIAVRGLLRFHAVVADAVHNKVFQRVYQILRPRLLWRIVRREFLPRIDPAGATRVIIAGAPGVTIGWQLARRYPDLTVTTSMSHSFADRPTQRQPAVTSAAGSGGTG